MAPMCLVSHAWHDTAWLQHRLSPRQQGAMHRHSYQDQPQYPPVTPVSHRLHVLPQPHKPSAWAHIVERLQAMEAMVKKRKQAVLAQRKVEQGTDAGTKQPRSLTRLWSYVAGGSAEGPQQALASIELEVRGWPRHC